jgi:metal-responsive CopG/Arc/MetJ family transcriptional regulator
MSHTNIVKIAITLPRREFRILESARKKDRETRSSIILRSIRHWLECKDMRNKILQYQTGYQNHPESNNEMEAMESAQAEALEPEDWS